MKKILLLMVAFLLLLSSFAFAEEVTDWVFVPGTEQLPHSETAWYYSPSHSKLSPQGRLETTIKSVCISTSNDLYSDNPGDYMISSEYVNPTFDMRMAKTITTYDKDGNVLRITNGVGWRPLEPGSAKDTVLQAAYKYAKEHNQ